MAVTPETLRSFGTDRVELRTRDGTFVGRFVPDALTERSILALFEVEDGGPEPLAVDLERIEAVARRAV